jgi:hypothetical protein
MDLSAEEQLDEVRSYNQGARRGAFIPREIAELLQSQPRDQQLRILRALLDLQDAEDDADETDD